MAPAAGAERLREIAATYFTETLQKNSIAVGARLPDEAHALQFNAVCI